MQEAYDLADRDDSEGYNSVKVMCSEVLGMINELLDERQWHGLTGDEIWDEWCKQTQPERDTRNFVAAFASAIEAKLKERNNA